jgi:probable O-glycosylation ligase (exosortase A-associated)
MRDLLVAMIAAGLLPVAFFRPFAGLLGFAFFAYFRPQDLAWTWAREMPFSLAIAIATVAGVVAGRAIRSPLFSRERLLRFDRTSRALALFGGVTAVSAVLSDLPDAAWPAAREFGKVLSIALLTGALCDRRERLRWLFLVVAFSLGAMGAKHALYAVRTGSFHILSGPGGLLTDNNDFGLALVMVLPILFHLGARDRSRAVRAASFVLGAVCTAAVFFTHSRGGFFALGVTTVAWMLTFRRKAFALVAGPALLVLTVAMVPRELVSRVSGLVRGKPDVSAELRVVAWRKAFAMAAGKPVFGVGPGSFERRWSQVPPAHGGGPITVHDTYLQVLAESGLVGLLAFVSLLVIALLEAGRAGRDGREPWRREAGQTLTLSLVGFAAGAVFLSRGHFDLPYQVMGAVAALTWARDQGETAFDALLAGRTGG